MAKKFDPKAKAKRQKIMAAVGGVLLLGLLAFQVPRTLKMLHPQDESSSPPAATTSAGAGTTTGPIAPPSLSGGNATPGASVSADGLSDPDAALSPQSGQLLVFSRFRSKDPFSQQITQNCTTGADQAVVCANTGSGSTGTAPAKNPPSDATTALPATSKAPPAPAAKPTTATISVNGLSESVRVGSQFPSSNPTFKLVSLTASSAKIGIAGGSFERGTQTVTLKKGRPLTLMNTADGMRYLLRLISVT